MLWSETRSCHARHGHHNDVEGHSSFSIVYSVLRTSLLWRSTVEFACLKVKSAKCLCLLPVVLVLLFRSWSWFCYFGLGLKNLVLFTSLTPDEFFIWPASGLFFPVYSRIFRRIFGQRLFFGESGQIRQLKGLPYFITSIRTSGRLLSNTRSTFRLKVFKFGVILRRFCCLSSYHWAWAKTATVYLSDCHGNSDTDTAGFTMWNFFHKSGVFWRLKYFVW